MNAKRNLTLAAFMVMAAAFCGMPALTLANEGPPAAEGHGMYPDDSKFPKGVIGVTLHLTAERVGEPAVLVVGHIHPEGPAGKAGLHPGDEFVAVDGVALAGKTHEEAVMMVRGEVGKTVALKIKSKDGTRDVSVVRVTQEELSGKRKRT
jgi:C-terminal processing protease CtpA/Prc